MEWFRWYHGACSDAKWPIIARKAGVSVGVVVSVWAALLEYASQDEERGSVSGFDGETYDALYGYADGTCGSVVAALTAKGIIRDGCIRAWSRRQPVREREDATNAERQRRYRERRRRTPDDAAVTPDNAVVTPPEQNRGEQRRTEEDIPLSPESDIFPDVCACEADGGEGRDGTARGDAVSGGADSAPDTARPDVPHPDATRQDTAPESRPGPARTDAPSKGTPEWTAFLSCWDVYPVKQGQEEAWREWMRLKRNGTLEAAWVIREAILTMCAEDSRWQRGKVPKFARWLNGKSWNDMPYVEPGDADALRNGRAVRDGPALPGDGRGKEPAAPTEYQRQRQSSRRMAAALLAGRREGGVTETGTGTGTGGVYEATAFATAGGTLPAARTGSLA